MVTSNSEKLSPHAKNETGNVYGKLTVIEFAYLKREIYWLCKCECGNTTTVRGSHLRSGQIFSCGCNHWSIQGKSKSPEYPGWQAMKQRCNNSRHTEYHLYGGRGISVCKRWQNSFLDFLADMGPKPSADHSIDRIDNDSDYEPDNCRWATKMEQSHNSRRVRMLTYDGQTMCISEWARKTGIAQNVITRRIDRGWSVERSLTVSPQRERYLTYNGETMCIAAWARRLGIAYQTLLYRIKQGWPEDHIFAPKK